MSLQDITANNSGISFTQSSYLTNACIENSLVVGDVITLKFESMH